MMTTKFTVLGMHCASCKGLIEDVCKDVQGVSSCEVDTQTTTLTVAHEDAFDLSVLKKEIDSLGEFQIKQIV